MSAQLSIIGNLGKDAQVKTNRETGSEFTVFSIGSNETYLDKQTKEKITKTTWFNCIIKGATIAKYLKKGDLVHVLSNSVEAKPFKKEDESVVASLNVRVRKLQFLASVKSDHIKAADKKKIEVEANEDNDSNDLPF